jgi:hypothetical protein
MNGKKINISELPNEVNIEKSAFLCCSSFEERSIIIPAFFSKQNFKEIFIFKNENLHPNIDKNALLINGYYNNASISCTKTDVPLLTASKIKEVVSSLVMKEIKNIVIDVTTFTHEMLLILLMIIYKNINCFNCVQCLYLGAKDYSINEKTEEKWLSKGCKRIRTVIGYPGKLTPGIPICLTVLVGFEHERALIMIEDIDPEYLVLGKGLPSDKSLTNPSHKAPMLYFQKILDDLITRRSGTSSFDFSCSELESTYNIIKKEIQNRPDANHIIVPLNTKISTLAAGIIALESTSIQICYSEPETYNFDGYSLSDEKVTIIDNIRVLLK